MNIKPLGDRILIKPLDSEEKTKGGIVLPDSAKEKPQEGEVIALGSGTWVGEKLVPFEVKIGDKVLFSEYGPEKIKIDGTEYKIAESKDILAIIK